MTFTLRDLLSQRPISRHDEEQIAEGKRRASHPEPEPEPEPPIQAVAERMAAARKARAAKHTARQSATREPAADTMKLPTSEASRRLYLTVVILAQQQIEEGYGPVVPHWKVMSELKDETFDESPRFMLQDLERDGFVRQIVTRKRGTLAWIPSVLDDRADTRGARSSKGGRSSDIRRAVDALETEYLKSSRR